MFWHDSVLMCAVWFTGAVQMLARPSVRACRSLYMMINCVWACVHKPLHIPCCVLCGMQHSVCSGMCLHALTCTHMPETLHQSCISALHLNNPAATFPPASLKQPQTSIWSCCRQSAQGGRQIALSLTAFRSLQLFFDLHSCQWAWHDARQCSAAHCCHDCKLETHILWDLHAAALSCRQVSTQMMSIYNGSMIECCPRDSAFAEHLSKPT